MSTPARQTTRPTIPERFARQTGKKICLEFTDLLAQSEEKLALDMLEEHPWMALRDAPEHRSIPSAFKNRPYLHIAILMNSLPLVDSLLSKGASLEQLDSRKRTAIFRAVQDAVDEDPHSERMAWALLDRGARCDGLNEDGYSLVYLKQGAISEALFHRLVEKGSPLSLRIDGESLLTQMLKNVYDLNTSDPAKISGRIVDETVLSAMAQTRLQNCRLRITAGADANVHAGKIETHALHVALSHGDTNMADFLVAHGANPLLIDDHRNTFLHSIKNNATAVRWLVDHGSDLEARNAWGETPLIFATRNIARANGPGYGHVIALMAAGADLDAHDHQGPGFGASPRQWLSLEASEAKGSRAYEELIDAFRAMEARQTAFRLLDEIAEPMTKARP